MKKQRIKNITCFILGGIVFGTIGVFASTAINSRDVSYTNTTSKLNSTNVQTAVDELAGKLSIGNATAAQILKDKTAMVGGISIKGTMANNGATGGTINPGGSYTIPAGYTSGGTVKANANQNSGTYTFATGSTGGTVDLGVNNTYRYVNAANVYAKGKSDAAATVNGYYKDISSSIQNGVNNLTSLAGLPSGCRYVFLWTEKSYTSSWSIYMSGTYWHMTQYGTSGGGCYYNVVSSTSQLSSSNRIAYVNGNWYYYEPEKVDYYRVMAVK